MRIFDEEIQEVLQACREACKKSNTIYFRLSDIEKQLNLPSIKLRIILHRLKQKNHIKKWGGNGSKWMLNNF